MKKFTELSYERPDVEAIKLHFRKQIERFNAAKDVKEAASKAA